MTFLTSAASEDVASAHVRCDDDAPLAIFARDLIWPRTNPTAQLLEQDGGAAGLRPMAAMAQANSSPPQVFAHLIPEPDDD